jgi:hypothetical protein
MGILTVELIAWAGSRSGASCVALEVWALLQVLLLTGGVLRSDLLAINALHGQALIIFFCSTDVESALQYCA